MLVTFILPRTLSGTPASKIVSRGVTRASSVTRGNHGSIRYGTGSFAAERARAVPRRGKPLAAAFRRSANRGNEYRSSGPSDGFHRRDLAVTFNAVAPGINRNRQRAQEAGNADPRTLEGTRGSGAALENPRASAGTGEPKPARVLAA